MDNLNKAKDRVESLKQLHPQHFHCGSFNSIYCILSSISGYAIIYNEFHEFLQQQIIEAVNCVTLSAQFITFDGL